MRAREQMQKEKTTTTTTTTQPKLVAALPNEMIGKILLLIKKDHEAEMSHWSHVYCVEVLDLKNTIAVLRNKIKHNALKARFAADRHLFRRQSGGGYAAPKHSHILWMAMLSIFAALFVLFICLATHHHRHRL